MPFPIIFAVGGAIGGLIYIGCHLNGEAEAEQARLRRKKAEAEASARREREATRRHLDESTRKAENFRVKAHYRVAKQVAGEARAQLDRAQSTVDRLEKTLQAALEKRAELQKKEHRSRSIVKKSALLEELGKLDSLVGQLAGHLDEARQTREIRREQLKQSRRQLVKLQAAVQKALAA